MLKEWRDNQRKGRGARIQQGLHEAPLLNNRLNVNIAEQFTRYQSFLYFTRRGWIRRGWLHNVWGWLHNVWRCQLWSRNMCGLRCYRSQFNERWLPFHIETAREMKTKHWLMSGFHLFLCQEPFSIQNILHWLYCYCRNRSKERPIQR